MWPRLAADRSAAARRRDGNDTANDAPPLGRRSGDRCRIELAAGGLRLELERRLGGSSSSAKSSPDLPIASKKRPITLPIFSDNKPIPSGRSPEKGPLIIYDWAFYLSPAVVKSFEQKYGVKAQVTTFASIDEALNKISSGAITPDVWVPDAEHAISLPRASWSSPSITVTSRTSTLSSMPPPIPGTTPVRATRPRTTSTRSASAGAMT